MKIIFIIIAVFGFIIASMVIVSSFVLRALHTIMSPFLRDKSKDKLNNDTKHIDNDTVIIDAEIVNDDGFIKKHIKDIYEYSSFNDEDISSSIKSLINTMENMDKYLSKNPGKTNDFQMLVDYYIPEIISHLQTYSNLAESNFKKENIDIIRKELLETISMVETGFSTALSELYDNDAMNVSASLEALKASLKMKGLAR